MKPRERTFDVLTQHADIDSSFSVPINISATSPVEAARKRFASQHLDSRRRTSALLVYDGNEAYVYPVENTPHVGDRPLVVGGADE